MKTRGSSVRFVLVSATVPNIDDIAHWIGSQGQSNNPAKIFEVLFFLPRLISGLTSTSLARITDHAS
jgi:hypothetical protein